MVATTVLAVTPLTISFPVALTELVVLVCGGAAMLLINAALLRRAVGPLRRLAATMREIDPLRPGQRLHIERADPDVEAVTEAFNDMLDRLEGERRDSARRALAAQEGERRRIARELHDEIGQSLTGMLLSLESSSPEWPPSVRPKLERSRETAREALETARELAARLRPPALDDLGLASALRALTSRLSEQTGLRIDRRLAGDLPAASAEAELVIYRVAQEALTNVARHSGADAAELRLTAGEATIELVVRDRGRGFRTDAQATTNGLRGMRERAMLVDAELQLSSRPGQGTTVRLVVPIAR